MNCIFITVFNQEKYVDMFFLLLESIFVYGNLNDDINILVYTSTTFMNIIKKNHLFNDEKIKFEINDTYNNIDKACKARVDLFNFSSITNYKKILYLDTDILIKDNINKVFDICEDDVLYVLEEGGIDSYTDCWGRTLFGDEINNYNDKTAFSSGILLFNNCEKIKDLFIKINEDIINRPYDFLCCDQPYIIYNAFKYNLYNNKILKSFAVNNDTNIHSDKIIHHFPGTPGYYIYKMPTMTTFLNSLKNQYKLNEGIICSVKNNLENKTYTWENSYITFLPNFKMKAFGEGSYSFIDNKTIIANFGYRIHNIKFNEDYTYFTSTRMDDLQNVNGKLIDNL